MQTDNLDEEDAHDLLCNEVDFARDYHFAGSEFVKNLGGRVRDDGDFDLQSVMLYSSDRAAGWKCVFDLTACPLVQYLKVGEGVVGLERIPVHEVPSRRDVEWVKRWYPWVG